MSDYGTVYNSKEEIEALATLDRITSTPAQRTNARVVLGMPYHLAMALEDKEETETEKEYEEWLKKQSGFWTVIYDDWWQGWIFIPTEADKK